MGLYTVVFRQQRLYADMGLQVVYFMLSLFGWYQWKFGGAGRTILPVSRATRQTWQWLVPLTLATGLTLGAGLAWYTDAAIPWLDAFLSAGSLAAQYLMTRKVLENWAIWIVLDIIYVPTFLSRGLYATAALYAVFLVLAIIGWREWKQSLTLSPQPA